MRLLFIERFTYSKLIETLDRRYFKRYAYKPIDVEIYYATFFFFDYRDALKRQLKS